MGQFEYDGGEDIPNGVSLFPLGAMTEERASVVRYVSLQMWTANGLFLCLGARQPIILGIIKDRVKPPLQS